MAYQKTSLRIKHYLQPFERILALLELSKLAKVQIRNVPLSNELQIESEIPIEGLTQRLAYWESATNGQTILTTQVLRESTVNVVKNGISPREVAKYFPFDHNVPLPGRRCLRYGPHGIHEYRGKFFPQLVKSLANIADLKRNDIILDPMCGSGTTPVEALLLGCRALAIDTSPLSVLMSKTKCDLLSINPDEILKEFEKVLQLLISNKRTIKDNWIKDLPVKDSEYLKLWFPQGVLSDLGFIKSIIVSISSDSIKNLFILSLSNILRRVSHQKTDDLRVRKEIVDESTIDCISTFLTELERSVNLVLAFLYREEKKNNNFWKVIQGDAREISRLLPQFIGKVNAVITSPPYATALPYIDTDRLSLCFLGLLPRSQIREINLKMIGNREITENIKKEYWNRYLMQKQKFPLGISKLIDSIHNLNKDTDAGFRRQNLPSLLAKYFFDMRDVLSQVKKMLAGDAPAYVVIGNNHTIAGGKRVDIKTAVLLGQIGESIGLRLENMIQMDMLVSRDIFKKNAVANETILCFRNA